ncbi:MAG: hypothetical protein ACFHU9_07900 [Fluviicola sp.]
MNFSEEHIAVFSSYLNGEMSASEKIVFEKQLGEDPVFRQSFEDFKQFENAIRDSETLETYDQVRLWEKEQQRKKNPAKIRRLWVAAASIAAVLIVAMFIWRPDTQPAQNELVSEYFQPYDNVITVRGKKEVLDKALLAYDRENYQEALQLFEEYPDDSVAVFYAAESLMALKKYDASIAKFDQVLSHNNVFREVAMYHKALALLGAGEKEKAAVQLKSIPKDSFYFEKTRALLKRL